MKKSTLIFFAALAAVLFFSSVSEAHYTSLTACEADCLSPYTCAGGTNGRDYVCIYGKGKCNTVNNTLTTVGYRTLEDCEYVRSTPFNGTKGACFFDGNYYRYQRTPCNGGENVTCSANCSSCLSSSECLICNSGYTKVNGACVKDTPSNTVNSCPSRMKLSDDGCCCINK